MATRNLTFWGTGYYADDTENVASIIVTFNGTVVYTGPVPSKNIDNFDRTAAVQQLLFSIDIDETIYGEVPMSVQCTGGDSVDVQQIRFDNILPVNPDFDGRTNVFLDGEPQTKGPDASLFPASGNWSYQIPNGSTLTHTLNIHNYDPARYAYALAHPQIFAPPF